MKKIIYQQIRINSLLVILAKLFLQNRKMKYCRNIVEYAKVAPATSKSPPPCTTYPPATHTPKGSFLPDGSTPNTIHVTPKHGMMEIIFEI